jgi:hypothetical protein
MSRREKELLSSSLARAAALFFGSAFAGVDGTGLRWRTSAMVTDPRVWRVGRTIGEVSCGRGGQVVVVIGLAV